MPMFWITNTGKATVHIPTKKCQIPIKPGSPKRKLELDDGTAQFIYRAQKRGGSNQYLQIEETDAEGKKVLAEALQIQPKVSNMLGPRSKPGPIRDLIAEAEEENKKREEMAKAEASLSDARKRREAEQAKAPEVKIPEPTNLSRQQKEQTLLASLDRPSRRGG